MSYHVKMIRLKIYDGVLSNIDIYYKDLLLVLSSSLWTFILILYIEFKNVPFIYHWKSALCGGKQKNDDTFWISNFKVACIS